MHGRNAGPRKHVNGVCGRVETYAQWRVEVLKERKARKTNDSDYVFMTFVLDYLPHGLLGC